jgi:transcriptional antiterminator NusG
VSDDPNKTTESENGEVATTPANEVAATTVEELESARAETAVEDDAQAASEESTAEESAAEESAADDSEVASEVDEADRSEPEASEPKESEPEEVAEQAPDEEAADEPITMGWYILKVQSNRERSIADALRRKIAIEGLDEYFGDVVVPTEKVTEFKAGKKKIVERKLYPGYIVVHMHINDDTWFAVRETSGIGDFTGSGGKPTPMLAHEVERIIHTEEEESEDAPKLNINFNIGDRVKIKDGTFESFEGEVNAIDEQSGRVTVMINIFGRSTPVELEYWQAEQI